MICFGEGKILSMLKLQTKTLGLPRRYMLRLSPPQDKEALFLIQRPPRLHRKELQSSMPIQGDSPSVVSSEGGGVFTLLSSVGRNTRQKSFIHVKPRGVRPCFGPRFRLPDSRVWGTWRCAVTSKGAQSGRKPELHTSGQTVMS